MTADQPARLEALLGAIRAKNELPPPAVTPIEPEVRTAMKFFTRGENLAPPRGLPAGIGTYLVTWFYDAIDLEGFARNVRLVESELFAAGARDGMPRYRGTYLKFASESDPESSFRTYWACDSLAQVEKIGVYGEDRETAELFRNFVDGIEQGTFRQSITVLVQAVA